MSGSAVVKASDILGRELRPDEEGSDAGEAHLALEYDVGCLEAYDPAPVDALRAASDEGACALAEEATLAAMRGLVAELWALPADDDDEGNRVAALPPPAARIPREKPLPAPRPPTRWEVFAARKGIKKPRRSRMVWSEPAQDWLPRYGAGSAKKRAAMDDWVVEERRGGGGGGDAAQPKTKRARKAAKAAAGAEDPFVAREAAKSKAVQRQKTNQLRNVRKAKRASAAHLGAIDVDTRAQPTLQRQGKGKAQQQLLRQQKQRMPKKRSTEQVSAAIRAAKVSTASMGRFDKPVDATRSVKAPKLRRKGRGFPQAK